MVPLTPDSSGGMPRVVLWLFLLSQMGLQALAQAVKLGFVALMFSFSAVLLHPFCRHGGISGPAEDIAQDMGVGQGAEWNWSSPFDLSLTVPFRLGLGISVQG